MINFFKLNKRVFLVFLFSCFFIFLFSSPVLAAGKLVKTASSPTVYYLAGDNVRHPFPTGSVYKSWYRDFSGLAVLTPDQMAQYPLGDNVKLRPGVKIATFETDPNLYAVAPGGGLLPFENRAVIAAMYGPKWFERVVKLPDAFFGDYVVGEKIKEAHELPDGFLARLADGEYYYKDNGLYRRFASAAAVKENNFQLSEAVTTSAQLDKRKRPISGYDENIFNPMVAPRASTADCENKKFKAAVILVAQDSYQPAEIEKLTAIKDRLGENFKWATDGLATLDVDFPVAVLSGDDQLLFTDTDGQKKPDNEAINTFYDRNDDIFDFIILYNNFVQNESVNAKYLTLTNDFAGTGNAQFHSAYNFGSRGKLKGVANMGNLAKYSVQGEAALNSSVNVILHELLHQFSGRAIFLDDDGAVNYSLLTGVNHDHWSMYNDFVSPLGGNGWRDNGDGTYTSRVALADSSTRRSFSDLDLYFMGLFPRPLMKPIRYLVPAAPNAVGNVIRGEIKEVPIEKIVEAMGEWGCRL